MRELVSLEEMKENLNILTCDDDLKIMGFISSASALILGHISATDETYPTEDFIPPEVKQATIVLVSHYYEDPFGENWPAGGEFPPSIRSLLSEFHSPVIS